LNELILFGIEMLLSFQSNRLLTAPVVMAIMAASMEEWIILSNMYETGESTPGVITLMLDIFNLARWQQESSESEALATSPAAQHLPTP